MPETKRFSVRLSDATTRTLDLLRRKLGLNDQADVIRLAISRLAEAEGITPARPGVKGRPRE